MLLLLLLLLRIRASPCRSLALQLFRALFRDLAQSLLLRSGRKWCGEGRRGGWGNEMRRGEAQSSETRIAFLISRVSFLLGMLGAIEEGLKDRLALIESGLT